MTKDHAETLVLALREQGYVCRKRFAGWKLGTGDANWEIVVTGLIVTETMPSR